jgi:hypothetical protein
VPPGILNYNGTKYVHDPALTFRIVLICCIFVSTVAVALWAVTTEAVSPTLELVLDDLLEGGVGHVGVNNPGWSPRT